MWLWGHKLLYVIDEDCVGESNESMELLGNDEW